MDAFISIAEARARRAEARRRVLVEEANAGVQRARAAIEHLTQEWESALIERDHEVEAVHARAEQLIAAYKSGVLEAHPRREEIPSLWKGEVIAMEPTGDTPSAVSGREEIGRILREVEDRIEVWHAEVLPRELPPSSPRQLSPALDDATAPDDPADLDDATDPGHAADPGTPTDPGHAADPATPADPRNAAKSGNATEVPDGFRDDPGRSPHPGRHAYDLDASRWDGTGGEARSEQADHPDWATRPEHAIRPEPGSGQEGVR